jgi:hypothetical protein
MKMTAYLSLVALTVATALPANAMDSMSSMSAMPMGGKMATCAPANPPVIVNTTKMTYMMDTHGNRMAMKGMMDHDKFVCKSTAMKMGAKMKPNTMMMAPHHTM